MHSNKTKILVITALLFAVAIVLAIVENFLIPLIFIAPGVKIGLSNIAVMYALFFVGKKSAACIGVLKSFFVFITRGFVAAILSGAGFALSFTAVLLLMWLCKQKISYLSLSICGAVMHNLGQLLAVSFIYNNGFLLYYLPILIISGTLTGISTAVLLKLFLPIFKKINNSY